MRDLPSGPALLALAHDVLLNDLLPLLPQEARLSARLVASSMAVAEREAIAYEELSQQIAREVERFYGTALTRSTERGEPDGYDPQLLRRLAGDLRAGAFEALEARERGARDILWRLTLGKLRLANPRFLAANGFD